MKIVEIAKAEAQLLELVEKAARGEPFIIAKSGKPLVKVTGLSAPIFGVRRLGFMAGQILVPDDFDQMGAGTINEQFGISPKHSPCGRVRRTDGKL
jgi:prevent-host-death family protein